MKKKSIKRNKAKANVFIDYGNYHYYLKKHTWEIDWERFKIFLNAMYDVVEIYYYEGVLSKAGYFDLHPRNSLEDFICMRETKKNYFKFLRNKGFRVRQKLVNRVYDSEEKRFKHKCNFDVEITIDTIDSLNNYEVCVLCSGDGDFIKLIRYLKGKYKKVVVIAGKDRLSKGAEKAANQVIYLKDIESDVMRGIK